MKIVNAARVAPIILRGASSTWSITEDIPEDCSAILAGKQIAVIAFWHSLMLPLWFNLRRLQPSALVSRSSDGEILARYLASIGYSRVLRGSSSSDGSRALAECVEALDHSSLLITPDGPRGPARVAKPGAMIASLRAGVPLVVAGWSSRRSVHFRSWDRMQAPLPFSVIRVRYRRFDLGGRGPGSTLTDADLARFTAALDDVSAP